MQLVAYGAQDIYLTGNPQITFFKVVYRRHTNFSMEAIEQTWNGTVGFDSRVTATISRNGDLVHRLYLEHTVGGNVDVCSNYGTAIIKTVECEIGGQRIDKHYGHWMEVWSELSEKNDSGLTTAYTAAARTAGTLFQNMSFSGGVSGVEGTDYTPELMFIPLQFWFCRNPGLALPLIALQYHEVKIICVTETAARCGGGTDANMGDLKLFADYIYLDTDERRRFAQVSHEYLIEQVQYQSNSNNTTFELNFNHPVKEIIWTGALTVSDAAGTGPSTPVAASITTGANWHLKLNGHDRFAARDYRYFTRTQVWQHHTGYGSVLNADAIAVYSFALKPEEHQPSGTCNFSRIDNAQLICSTTSGADVHIYAVNYNVLRIMSGMGGLAYSN